MAEGGEGYYESAGTTPDYVLATDFKAVSKALRKIEGNAIIFMDATLPKIHGLNDFVTDDSDAKPLWASEEYSTMLRPGSPRIVILVCSKGAQANVVRDAIRGACTDPDAASCVDSRSGGIRGTRDAWVADEICEQGIALYYGNCLVRLWSQSVKDGPGREWYEENPPMIHGAGSAWGQRQKVLRNQRRATDSLYDSALADALGFDLPEAWLRDFDDFAVLHENLKRLAGSKYIGAGAGGRVNLSVGAVYLIACFAYRSTQGDWGPFSDAEWRKLEGSTAPFLVSQDRDIARETALCMFEMFRRLFFDETQVPMRVMVNGTRWDKDTRGFQVTLEWDGSHLASAMGELYGPMNQWKLPRFPKNTTESTVRLLACMHLQSAGFGHPGQLYMVRRTLYVRG